MNISDQMGSKINHTVKLRNSGPLGWDSEKGLTARTHICNTWVLQKLNITRNRSNVLVEHKQGVFAELTKGECVCVQRALEQQIWANYCSGALR